MQLVSEIGAGEGPAWNPAIGLVSSFGSVYVHDVENPNRGEPKVYLKDLGTNGCYGMPKVDYCVVSRANSV